jgi:lipopolysaccharide/colanic/teichoic acid biosynthesis glycosyltransferase
VLSSVLTVLLSPLLLVVAAVVRLSSGKPVLYRQVRVGRDGELFTLLKFRTMVVDADASGGLTVGDDARVTPVGRVLRRHRLDELPQLLNVLRGDMALVGARPELPGYFSAELADLVLQRRPGITDPASLQYRDEAALLAQAEEPDSYYRDVVLPDKARISSEYALRRTAASDLRVLVRTAGCLLPGRRSGCG